MPHLIVHHHYISSPARRQLSHCSQNILSLSYFLTLTSFQPLYGKLSDIFGRKECLLFSYTVFAIGCLGCGLSQDMVQLCVSRAVAGIGGGGMNSIVSILMSDIVPLRDRGVYQGYINIVYAAGTSTGAPLGGLLADSVGWRWSFMAQVPLCVLAWLAVYFVLDLPPMDRDHWLVKLRRIDFLGAFALILTVVALLVGLDSGSNNGWDDLMTIVSLALTPVLAAFFLFVEIKVASHPFAPGHIIFDKSLFAAYMVNFLASAGQLAVFFFLPLFFQAVQGMSATESGALLVPGMIGSVAASVGCGVIIKRTGKFYWLTVWSYALLIVSLVPITLSVWFNSTIMCIIGLVLGTIGAGAGITSTLIGLLANAAQTDSAVVIACSYLFRSLGSSIGISVTSAVLQQVLRDQLARRLTGDEAAEIEEKVRPSLEVIKELPPYLAKQVRESYQIATLASFAPMFFFCAVAFVFCFWIKEKSLKR